MSRTALAVSAIRRLATTGIMGAALVATACNNSADTSSSDQEGFKPSASSVPAVARVSSYLHSGEDTDEAWSSSCSADEAGNYLCTFDDGRGTTCEVGFSSSGHITDHGCQGPWGLYECHRADDVFACLLALDGGVPCMETWSASTGELLDSTCDWSDMGDHGDEEGDDDSDDDTAEEPDDDDGRGGDDEEGDDDWGHGEEGDDGWVDESCSTQEDGSTVCSWEEGGWGCEQTSDAEGNFVSAACSKDDWSYACIAEEEQITCNLSQGETVLCTDVWSLYGEPIEEGCAGLDWGGPGEDDGDHHGGGDGDEGDDDAECEDGRGHGRGHDDHGNGRGRGHENGRGRGHDCDDDRGGDDGDDDGEGEHHAPDCEQLESGNWACDYSHGRWECSAEFTNDWVHLSSNCADPNGESTYACQTDLEAQEIRCTLTHGEESCEKVFSMSFELVSTTCGDRRRE